MRLRIFLPLMAAFLWTANASAQTPPPEAGGAPPPAPATPPGAKARPPAPPVASPPAEPPKATTVPPAAAPPAASAPAASPPPAGPPTAAPAGPAVAGRNRGLMVIGAFGVDGCTDNWCDDVDPMVFMRVQALFRFFEYAAAGLHAAFLFQYPDDQEDQDTSVFWNLILGGEIRGIIPGKKFEAWTGFVFGWSRWMWEVESVGQDFSQWMNGFVLGWGFGADYYLTPGVAAGFAFYLYKPWYKKWCMKNGDKSCMDLDEPPLDAEDQIGIWWTVGFALTFFLPF